MLLSGIILVSSVSFFTYTNDTIYLVLIPIFVSTRYFSKKIISVVSIITIILFITSCLLNVYLEPHSDIIVHLHENASYNSWQRLFDASIYIIIPCLLVMVFLSIFSINMTSSGRKLIISKITSTKKIAAVDAEINLASQIQRSVLPSSKFVTPNNNFNVFAYESPAKEVCGDFYDYFMLSDDILAVLVADVSDKGMSAAMFMMSAKKALQCAMLSTDNLKDAIKLANELICNDNQYGMFLTFWLGVIDTKSGFGKYVNAGHPFPILKHKNGDVEFVENEPDLFVGNFKDKTPKVHTFTMQSDDTLLIYTDGLTDTTDKNGNSFSINKVIDSVKISQNNAEQMVSDIVSSAKTFSADSIPFDDITLFALKCNNLTAPIYTEITENIGIDGTAKISNSIQELLKNANCPEDKRRNIGTAIDEICHNISEYAYPEKSGNIDVISYLYNNCLEITFIDGGIEFNPLLHNNPNLYPIQVGGLGIYLVKQLADNMYYEYKDNQNRLKLNFIWDM